MRFALIAAMVAALSVPAPAWSDVFKCVDAEGRITYTNTPGTPGRCERMSQDQPVSSVPAPRPRTPGAEPASPASPASFPRVSPDAQRARDDTRRQILEKELADEEASLAQARETLAAEETRDAPEDRNIRRTGPDGRSYSSINVEKMEARLQPFRDKVELHQRNVEALQRELRSLR